MSKRTKAPAVLNTEQAAERLGISVRWVTALCKQGRLGQRFGRRPWLITEAELVAFAKKPRKPGRRPKKK